LPTRPHQGRARDNQSEESGHSPPRAARTGTLGRPGIVGVPKPGRRRERPLLAKSGRSGRPSRAPLSPRGRPIRRPRGGATTGDVSAAAGGPAAASATRARRISRNRTGNRTPSDENERVSIATAFSNERDAGRHRHRPPPRRSSRAPRPRREHTREAPPSARASTRSAPSSARAHARGASLSESTSSEASPSARAAPSLRQINRDLI